MEFSKDQKEFLRRFVGEDTTIDFGDTASPFWVPNIILDVVNIVKIDCKYDVNNPSTRSLEVWSVKNNPKYKGIYSIFDCMYFLNYLRDNNYITVLTMADQPQDGKYRLYHHDDDIRVSRRIYKKRNDDEIEEGQPIYNIEIEGLKNWWCECIYPRPLLLELVASDFKTPEQRQFEIEMQLTKDIFKKQMRVSTKMFKKQFCATLWAIWVSVIALVLSTAVGVCGIFKDGDTKTAPQQHKESINSTQSTLIDTTQIKIIKPTSTETNLKKKLIQQ